MKSSLRVLVRSMKAAIKGVRTVFKEEQNFRIEVFIAFIIIVLMIAFAFEHTDAVLILVMIVLVLAAEMLNSALERLVDIAKPRLHDYAEHVKNIIAGAVLLVSVFAFVVGLIIFIPYIT